MESEINQMRTILESKTNENKVLQEKIQAMMECDELIKEALFRRNEIISQ